MSKVHLVDLLTDESFQAWLEGRAGAAETRRWDEWLASDPLHRDRYEEAREIWKSMQFVASPSPDAQRELAKLGKRLKLSTPPEAVPPRQHSYSRQHRRVAPGWIWAGAAAVLVVVFLGVWRGMEIFQSPALSEMQLLTTRNGEQVKVNFPDQTMIVVNANSTLEYPKYWTAHTPRRVKLQGEAYFEVASGEEGTQKTFRVDTKDGVVAVVGTRFAVYERGRGTRVVLEKGRLQIAAKEAEKPVDQLLTRTTLTPGNMVLFHKGDPSLHPQPVAIESYISWWKDSLILRNTPFREVLQRLEETYGVQVEVTNQALLERSLTGAVETANLEVMAETLGKVLQVPVHRKKNTVIFGIPNS